jgi:hypothetical protein
MKLYIQPISAMDEAELRAVCEHFGAVEEFSPAGKGVFVTLNTDWGFDHLATDMYHSGVIVIPGETGRDMRESLPDPLYKFALNVAGKLGEEGKSVKQIIRLIKLCGPVFVEAMWILTQDLMENGGLLTDDGSRKRTPGGVFFKLAKGYMYADMRSAVRGRTEVKETGA